MDPNGLDTSQCDRKWMKRGPIHQGIEQVLELVRCHARILIACPRSANSSDSDNTPLPERRVYAPFYAGRQGRATA